MASRKLEHLNERIRQKLGTILELESNDPRFRHVTVTGVTLSKDMSHARVTFSTYDSLVPGKPNASSKKSKGAGDIASLTQALNRASGFFSQAIARTLETRISPRFTFAYDPAFDYTQEMENKLKPLRAAGEMGDPNRKTGESGPSDSGETP